MDLNSIRCNIKRLRKSARITQKEMALKLFMDERTYSKFERGENKSMDIRLLDSIASILCTDLPVLLQNAQEQDIQQPDPEQHHPDGRTYDELEHEVRILKDEVKELILCHKEALKLIKIYSE